MGTERCCGVRGTNGCRLGRDLASQGSDLRRPLRRHHEMTSGLPHSLVTTVDRTYRCGGSQPQLVWSDERVSLGLINRSTRLLGRRLSSLPVLDAATCGDARTSSKGLEGCS